MVRQLALSVFLLPLLACNPSPTSVPAQGSPTKGQAPEPIPGVTSLEPVTPAPAPAPAAPATSPTPPPVSATAQPASAPTPTGDWGQVLSEKVENGTLTTVVQSPWGPITVKGPSEGPGGAVTRYWQAWAKVDFASIYAFTAGQMRERLGSLDNPAGHKEYRESIADRYKDDPAVTFEVEAVADQGNGKVAATVRNTTRSGQVQTRECYLVQTPEGWKFELIRQQR